MNGALRPLPARMDRDIGRDRPTPLCKAQGEKEGAARPHGLVGTAEAGQVPGGDDVGPGQIQHAGGGEVLNFFPTPYPGELWYSVLCRYHMRTDHTKSATTIRELFDGRLHAAMGIFCPAKAINDILGQLPPGLLDIRGIILNHTLFPYFYRINPVEKKDQALKELCEGTAITPTWLWKTDSSASGLSELPPVPAGGCRPVWGNLLAYRPSDSFYVCLPEAWMPPGADTVQPGAGQRKVLCAEHVLQGCGAKHSYRKI